MSVNDRLIKTELARHEAVIERGMRTTIEVGLSMKAILDEKLYEGEYKTFENYVNERWGYSRTRAYQLIEAAEVDFNLSTIVDKAARPQNEGQLREVAKAPLAMQVEVVKKAAEKAAAENRKPTAKDYRQVVGELVLEDVEPAEKPDDKPQLTPEEQLKADRKKARSYAEYLQRSIDDLNRVKPNRSAHSDLIKYCGQILGGLERW